MKVTNVDLRGFNADMVYTIKRVANRLGWRFSPVYEGIFEIKYPKDDEEMFLFIFDAYVVD